MKVLLLLVLLFGVFLPSGSEAQDIAGVEKTGIIYRKVMHGGVSIHSRGLGLHFRRGMNLHASKAVLLDVGLITIRHPKEVKSVNSFSNNSGGFLYGKLNSLNSLHTGVGVQKILHQKGDIGTTAIGYSLYGGISWGMAKPVYLYIFHTSDLDGIQEKLEKYDPEKHYPDNISGRAPFVKGLNGSRFYPGAYGSLQLNFDFGKQETRIRMFEAGISADVFPARIRIMADEKKGQYIFFNFFIRFIYGKQWNHP